LTNVQPAANRRNFRKRRLIDVDDVGVGIGIGIGGRSSMKAALATVAEAIKGLSPAKKRACEDAFQTLQSCLAKDI